MSVGYGFCNRICLLSILTPRSFLPRDFLLNLDLTHVRVFRHHAEEQAVVDVADGALHHVGLARRQSQDEYGEQHSGYGYRIADP